MTKDPTSWTEMIEPLRRFIRRRVGDEHVAADLTQDVLLKAHAGLATAPEGGRLAAWLFQIARNTVIDHYRSRAVRDHADIDADSLADGGEAEQEAVRDLTPCLTRMVELLPEPYREAMRLADLEGLSQQEVADRAAISLSGAKSRVQRARQMLRDMVLDCCRVERDGRGNAFDFETTERSSWYCGNDDEGGPKCSG